MKELAEATDLLHQLGQFPPSVKKGKYFDVAEGIISHLTKECGGNVHDSKLVATTAGSFEKTTYKKTEIGNKLLTWRVVPVTGQTIPIVQKIFRRLRNSKMHCQNSRNWAWPGRIPPDGSTNPALAKRSGPR
jgi:hypothetical protein